MRRRTALFLGLAQIGLIALLQAQQAGAENWVATWSTAQQLTRPAPPQTPAAPPASSAQSIGTGGFSNQTVRMITRTSIGGKQLRLKLTNAFGSAPVGLGTAHVALRGKGSEIVPGSDRTVTFGGKPGCTLGPGMVILSDPVELGFPALADLAVSLYFPGWTGPPTTHATGLHTTYTSKAGDVTGQAAIADAITTQSYYFLAGIEVLAPAEASLIVALGDSITDGARSTPDTDHSWPALLAARLAARKDTANVAVANMGIGGNRLLRDISGASALARFDRDVLSQSGVKWLVVMEGINDIGRGASTTAEAVTTEDLIFAHKQIIEHAHAHGIKVIGATLTPYEGAAYFREEGEAIRQALNAWIRSRGAFDAVADFDAATRDPASPRRIRAEFDPGDHLHPNDAGYQAMADAIDVSIFTGRGAPTAPAKR